MENERRKGNELFKEVITEENVLRMSEVIALCEIKFLMRYKPNFMIDVYNNLVCDLNHKDEWSYQLSDSYDLVQEIGLFLCQNMGKRLHDTYRIDKKGKTITIEIQAEKNMMRLLARMHRNIIYQYDIDDISEAAYMAIELDDEEPANTFSEDKFDEVVAALNLNEMQITALRCRLNGMSYPQIAQVINRCLSTTYECLQKVIKRCVDMYC